MPDTPTTPGIPEGAPCWADITLPDIEAGKRFYGELLGWTFGESAAEYGGYTQATVDDKLVAALSPPMPGQEDAPPEWTLYLASPDIQATAAKVRENGGEVLMEPMAVGPFGSMLLAKDPSGLSFAAWQPGTHHGFEKQGEPGAFSWVEFFTNDVAAVDAFYPAVFPYAAKRMGDSDEFDYKVWMAGDIMVGGRCPVGTGMPGVDSPRVLIYFAVDNCDDAVATVTKLGGRVTDEPQDSPYGRVAAVTDPQGAGFAVIDPSTTVGEMPPFQD
jgi:uncharacterized protein